MECDGKYYFGGMCGSPNECPSLVIVSNGCVSSEGIYFGFVKMCRCVVLTYPKVKNIKKKVR